MKDSNIIECAPQTGQLPVTDCDDTRLVWLDLEMTGLAPEQDLILELAMVITDQNLNIVAESPVWAIHQSDEQLTAMDEWNQKTHGQSGLIARVRASTYDEAEVEAAALAFLQPYLNAGKSPMCGNSIGQDRRFLARYMPQLESWFHYRNLDVSTLKELCQRWTPALAAQLTKESRHEALADVFDSIDELKFYREHFLRV